MNVKMRCNECDIERKFDPNKSPCKVPGHGRQVYDLDEAIPASSIDDRPGPDYAQPMEPPPEPAPDEK